MVLIKLGLCACMCEGARKNKSTLASVWDFQRFTSYKVRRIKKLLSRSKYGTQQSQTQQKKTEKNSHSNCQLHTYKQFYSFSNPMRDLLLSDTHVLDRHSQSMWCWHNKSTNWQQQRSDEKSSLNIANLLVDTAREKASNRSVPIHMIWWEQEIAYRANWFSVQRLFVNKVTCLVCLAVEFDIRIG